ncbi:MAG: hypothetical protein CM15mV16_0360 [uncultured marine virus]|nr:MAG: hypothetical protein CM15mV16_0360 [uncultured marine virus]
MSNYIDDLLSKQKVMGDSDKLKEIINHIKTNKSVTKRFRELSRLGSWN